MDTKESMGRLELGCMVFNSVVYKIFTHYPGVFAENSGSASWVTAIFTAVIFLGILWFLLKLYSPYARVGLAEAIKEKYGSAPAKGVSVLAVVYFGFSFCYGLYSVCRALKTVSYITSPMWFIGFFLVLGCAVILVCGEKAVRRLHSLFAIGVGATLTLIVILSLRYSDVFNLAPILGTGAGAVFGKGLQTLFLYSDILVIFFLPKHNNKYSFKKTVMLSAILGAAVNVIVITAMALNSPWELAQKLSLPIYPLTKTANLGKVPLRLDTLYHTATIVSAILFLSLVLSILLKNIRGLALKPKGVTASALCLILCFSLCGCYDGSEIEENAYVIAIGIDKGEAEAYKYTFQISNPLESGGSIGAEEKAQENAVASDEINKTVDNIVVEAEDYFLARDKLKQLISKDVMMTHLKVIALSLDVAKEDALKHGELLFHEREIRPGTNLCLSESAMSYLFSVNPTLEESTVRYYELFFRNRDVPSSPVTELREFVGRSLDPSYDGVIPVVNDDGFSGMGIFSDGIMKEAVNAEDGVTYKLLQGDLHGVAIEYMGKSYVVSSNGKPKMRITEKGKPPVTEISVCLKSDSPKIPDGFTEMLESRAEAFLYKTAYLNCDVLGIGRHFKSRCVTQRQWEDFDWDKTFPACNFNVKILLKFPNNSNFLQFF